MRLLHLIISALSLATHCSAQTKEEDTKVALHIDCTLLRLEDHGQSLTLYVRGRFVQDSGPSKIPEDMLNSSEEKGISISARKTSDQKKLDLIRSQLIALDGGRLHIGEKGVSVEWHELKGVLGCSPCRADRCFSSRSLGSSATQG